MGGETIPKEELKSSYPVRSEGPVGKWIPSIYRDRIAMFYGGGQYEHKNLRA
jgi:alpha-mannosidase